MAGPSTYLTNALLNWFKGANMPVAPSAVWVALYNGDPGNAGTAAGDVTGTIRPDGRVSVPWGNIVGKSLANEEVIDFGVAAGTANVTHFGLWDAASGGNFLGGIALQTPRSIQEGDPAQFMAGDLAIDVGPA